MRFLRQSDAGDGLQIGNDAHLIPVREKLLNLTGDGAADFQNEPSTRTQGRSSLRNKPRNDLKPRRSGKDRGTRFKLADFQLDLILFRFPNLRWVGDDKIQACKIEAVQQIRLVELDALLELVACRVSAGDLERGSRHIGSMNFGRRKFLR